MGPPRHCMVVDNHYPDIRVERETKALVERGYLVDIVCLRAPGEPPRENLGSVTVYRVPVARRRGASIAAQLGEYLVFLLWATAMVAVRHTRRPYASVQVHNLPDFLVFSAAVPKLLGARVVLDLHDLMPEFLASRLGGDCSGVVIRAVKLQERLAASFSDRVITVTDLWRRQLINRGIPAQKLAVVMNLPDERIFSADRTVDAPDGPLTVVYHGTMTRRYGLDILLDAFVRASRRVPLRLLLHGRGEYVEEVRRLAAQHGVSDQVELSTELLPTIDMAALIRRGQIGVVPNRNDIFTDGILPTKLMEYAALGIPAVVSRSSAVEAYFTDEMVRFVAPGDPLELADALCELATDPERRRRQAANAAEFTKRYRWKDHAAAYADLIDELNGRQAAAISPAL